MILTLEVTGPQAQTMGAGHRKVFKAIGGTIGRLPDNDWVFPDPYVSGRHALIRYLNGKYFVEDTSTNGVFINSTDKRLARGQPQQLRDGDVMLIDAYKISVSIQQLANVEPRNDPFAGLQNGQPKSGALPKRVPMPVPTPIPAEDKTASLSVEGIAANGFDEYEDEDDGEQGTQWFGVADIEEKFSQTSSLPVGLNVTKLAIPKPVPAPPVAADIPAAKPEEAPSTPGSGDSQLQTLLDAAGIKGLAPSHEVAKTLGEILNAALSGTMEALRVRERMKDDLRMRGTTFKTADNNPLKFSANVDDAFHNLLVKQNPAYLTPTDAFDEAYRDVCGHQAALQAAMRLAFETMLSQFDPQRLQEEFDRQIKGSILGVPAKMRYWDLYRDKYGERAQDAETSFRTLFGDAFARAYEEHLERLRKQARSAG